jgi:beta-mannosidase
MVQASSKLVFNKDWLFSQIGGGPVNKDGEWLRASKAPTSVHAELLRLEKIPNPFVGLNEWEVQCTYLLYILIDRDLT